jgi:anti-sigma regulatory factor (Ser/Thr protein kinase)
MEGGTAAFEHVAVLYEGDGFVDAVLPFVREGIDRDEPILVAVGPEKIDLLRPLVGEGEVEFVDLCRAGRNPARILPIWAAFARDRSDGGRRPRGVGEPIWAGRTSDELTECAHHEALLNVAFEDGVPWTLACPYDVSTLSPEVIDTCLKNHPLVRQGALTGWSTMYRGSEGAEEPLDAPLDAGPDAHVLRFGERTLVSARGWVGDVAAALGLSRGRIDDLRLAVDEVMANSVVHGGGHGELRCWGTGDAVVCEVRDGGRLDSAMVGRVRPRPYQRSGYGLWLANQLCDLVQIRSVPDGTVIRLQMRRDGVD